MRHNLALQPDARSDFQDSVQAFVELSQHHPERMNHRDCSQNIALLRNKLINMGSIIGQARFSHDGDLIRFNKHGFEEEIAILKRYVRRLGYSSALHNWINERRRATVRALRENYPVEDLWHEWQASSSGEKLDILNTVLNVHRIVYSGGAVPLRAPVIKVIPADVANEKHILGCVSNDYEDLAEGVDPVIEIAATLLESDPRSFRETMLTGHHEFVHWVLSSMVAAMHTRELRAHHWSWPDIRMEDEKLKAGAIIDSAIKPVYYAQPEERLCYNQEDSFCAGYLRTAPDLH